MLSDDEMLDRMRNGWRAGRPFTECGNGSTLAATSNIRQWLPSVPKRYGVKFVCDAGAGDQKWIQHMSWDAQVRAFDLVPRSEEIEKLDITRERLPGCDAILCRMVLNHLDPERICMALALFKRSARYLIATQFQGEDLPQRSKQFCRLDLRGPPYNLGEPLELIQDGNELCCWLALWRL